MRREKIRKLIVVVSVGTFSAGFLIAVLFLKDKTVFVPVSQLN